ncbi:MAG: GAF domain-containing protein, partial [Acidobacteriota bacterium]
MSPQRLKWLVITAPPVVMLMLELAHLWVLPRLKEGTHRIVVDVLVVLGAMLFYGLLCAVSDKNQSRLQRKNDELEALHSASLAIAAELSLEAVLQRVADQARQLIGARYCALAIYGEDRNIEAFLTSGIDEETRKNIGDLPVGKGLLGLTLDRAESLRLHDLGDDPRSVGFPPGHPEMRSLLAVRIPAPAPFRGNLYLSEKLDGGPFTEEDQGIVRRFAIQAAIAVDNARLHRQVAGLATAEERLRLARELHDDRAQILAFFNTAAAVTKEHLRQNRHDLAAEHLDKLS